ncbi:MAG: hypothetical protein ACR5LD_11490 [Symbiopectobacterium sp.]
MLRTPGQNVLIKTFEVSKPGDSSMVATVWYSEQYRPRVCATMPR